MPDVYLTGKEEYIDEALSLLERALVNSSDPTTSIAFIEADTADHESNPLQAKYVTIEKVYRENDQIIIWPRNGINITIRTEPLRHKIKNPPTAHATHLAYVDLQGDFLTIINPYYFYEDQHKVSYRKYCFHAPGLASR